MQEKIQSLLNHRHMAVKEMERVAHVEVENESYKKVSCFKI
jgi:hypothetical protein